MGGGDVDELHCTGRECSCDSTRLTRARHPATAMVHPKVPIRSDNGIKTKEERERKRSMYIQPFFSRQRVSESFISQQVPGRCVAWCVVICVHNLYPAACDPNGSWQLLVFLRPF